VQQLPPAPPPASSSWQPVFESEEEALAAAEVAYRAYSEMSELVLSEGGKGPARLAAVATGLFLDVSIQGAESFEEHRYRQVGATSFDSPILQVYDPSSALGIVTIYVCDDASGVDVVDASGASVVAAGRQNRTLFQATFDLVNSDHLLISGREVWNGGEC